MKLHLLQNSNLEKKIIWPAKCKKSSAIVLILSGGMDSAVLLKYLHLRKINVHALSFDYGGKHNKKEIPRATRLAKLYAKTHKIIKLSFFKDLFKSSLLDNQEEIPSGHYMDESMKKTVVPFRNGIMLSIAIGFAENANLKWVMLGSHSGDHPIYPDCRLAFTQAFSKAAMLGTYQKVEVISPFNKLDKRDIGDIGRELELDFQKTWTCYKGLGAHCGKCGACQERKYALRYDEGLDQTEYLVKIIF